MTDSPDWMDGYGHFAPYNFVPLAPFVHLPDWAQRISHDVPYAGGLSGAFDLIVTAETPILIGGERKKDAQSRTEVFFVTDTAGRAFIPGSTLRGLLRSTVEIASFGKLCRTDAKRRFGVRDLTRGVEHIYQNRVTTKLKARDGIRASSGAFMSSVRAGRLRFEGGAWEIAECRYARIEQTDLERLLGLDMERLNPAEYARRQKGSKEKGGDSVTRWTALDLRADVVAAIRSRGGESTACWLRPSALIPAERDRGFDRDGKKKPSLWDIRVGAQDLFVTRERAEASGVDAPVRATIVVTGTIGIKKHREFLFIPDEALPVHPVSAEVMESCRTIHSVSPSGARNEGLWQEWKPLLDSGELDAEGGIPVFFIVSENGQERRVEGFGFAQLPKLAYPYSVGDMIRHRSAKHFDDRNDVAEAIFGTVREAEGSLRALRGRIAIGHARLTGPAGPAEPFTCILAAPKPSYFPFYVEQDVAEDASHRLIRAGAYRSYLPDVKADTSRAAGAAPPVIRGWKRYRPFNGAYPGRPDLSDGSEKLQSVLHPLPAPATFVSRVTFHNLRPVELGAVLFALGVGDRVWDAEAEPENRQRHALGMGKPYGFGTVRLTLRQAILRRNGKRDMTEGEDALDLLDRCHRAFEDEMDEAITAFGGEPEGARCWSRSEQKRALRALTRPGRLFEPGRHRPDLQKDLRRARFPYPRIPMGRADEARAGSAREENDFARLKANHALMSPLDLFSVGPRDLAWTEPEAPGAPPLGLFRFKAPDCPTKTEAYAISPPNWLDPRPRRSRT